MKKTTKCRKCGIEMYQDDQGKWFCPDCVLEEIDPRLLDEGLDHPGKLKRPYVLEPPTKQVRPQKDRRPCKWAASGQDRPDTEDAHRIL